jgi:hypothetical protein
VLAKQTAQLVIAERQRFGRHAPVSVRGRERACEQAPLERIGRGAEVQWKAATAATAVSRGSSSLA